jgi:hypothetical protein
VEFGETSDDEVRSLLRLHELSSEPASALESRVEEEHDGSKNHESAKRRQKESGVEGPAGASGRDDC